MNYKKFLMKDLTNEICNKIQFTRIHHRLNYRHVIDKVLYMSYDQNQVNESLTETFGMAPMDNNQNLQTAPKKKGRGGARPGSGRKVGSTVKLSAADVLAEIARLDKPFAEGLAEDYIKARHSGDMMVIQRYQQMLLAKVIADKTETDITSKGKQIGANFTFPTQELDDWKDA